jgi:hypothetical protein
MENIEEAVMAVYKDMAKAGKLTEENAPLRAIA